MFKVSLCARGSLRACTGSLRGSLVASFALTTSRRFFFHPHWWKLKIVPPVIPPVRTCHCKARAVVPCVKGFPARAVGRTGSKLSVKLEHAARNPTPHRWAGPEQPALWTDVLAEMSRHIYIRNKLGEGIQAPIFQVPCVTYKLIS